jgi:hypothetical protein
MKYFSPKKGSKDENVRKSLFSVHRFIAKLCATISGIK